MADRPLEDRAVISFRNRPLTEPAWPAGYARLIEKYELDIPLPPRLTAISVRYRPSETDAWKLLGSRSDIPDTLAAHLTLALKWEGVDLAALNALFAKVPAQEITHFVTDQPKSAYGRRIWFLYEWLTGDRLPIDDLAKATSVPVLDPDVQFALNDGELSARHRVTNNLPGTPAFCPLVRRTSALRTAEWRALAKEARTVLGTTHPDVLRRAGDFLLLADSRASFQIEGERPPTDRLQRWGLAIRDAGRTRLSIAELVRLQHLVIGDARFVRVGLRVEDGFVGMHDRQTREPLPDHISARPDDLTGLVQGVVDYIDRGHLGGLDPVVLAATAAFGLVYIHPFEDGNGRLHRWLIHHVLALGDLVPDDVVFPVSRVILDRLSEYKAVLESYSLDLLPFIKWEVTETYNVRVSNDTADYYRYFDATRHSEFLYSCVEQTIRENLPDEVRYLEAYDEFESRLQLITDLPPRLVGLIQAFLDQNGGRLSRRVREWEFAALSDDEVARVESVYRDTLGRLTPRRSEGAGRVGAATEVVDS